MDRDRDEGEDEGLQNCLLWKRVIIHHKIYTRLI